MKFIMDLESMVYCVFKKISGGPPTHRVRSVMWGHLGGGAWRIWISLCACSWRRFLLVNWAWWRHRQWLWPFFRWDIRRSVGSRICMARLGELPPIGCRTPYSVLWVPTHTWIAQCHSFCLPVWRSWCDRWNGFWKYPQSVHSSALVVCYQQLLRLCIRLWTLGSSPVMDRCLWLWLCSCILAHRWGPLGGWELWHCGLWWLIQR